MTTHLRSFATLGMTPQKERRPCSVARPPSGIQLRQAVVGTASGCGSAIFLEKSQVISGASDFLAVLAFDFVPAFALDLAGALLLGQMRKVPSFVTFSSR